MEQQINSCYSHFSFPEGNGTFYQHCEHSHQICGMLGYNILFDSNLGVRQNIMNIQIDKK